MKKLLRLKHWQVFLALVVLPVAAILALIFLSPLTVNYMRLISLVPFLTFAITALQYGWLYLLGVSLHSKLPFSVKMNLVLFRSLFIAPVLYMLSTLALGFLWKWQPEKGQLLIRGIGDWELIRNTMRLVQWFSFLSVLYFLYFISRTLRSAEQGAEVGFSDYISVYLLLLFLPIGVWIIQPRINELADVPVQDVNPEILDGGM